MSTLGYKHSEETKLKMRSEGSGSWKGNKVRMSALHMWIRKYKPMSETCEICHLKKRLDAANISQKYKRDINDFRWLCRRCHLISDGRMEQIKKRNDSRRFLKKIPCFFCKKVFLPCRRTRKFCSPKCSSDAKAKPTSRRSLRKLKQQKLSLSPVEKVLDTPAGGL